MGEKFRGENYGCPECGVWFFTSAAVRVHLDNEHNSPGENGNGTQEIPENAQGRPSRYGCTHCTQSFYSKCLAVDHMKTHTEIDGWESDGEMRCDGNQENNSVETEEDNMEIDRVNGGAENKVSEVTRDGNEDNNSVETEEDNMEIDRVNGGAENKGSEVTRDGNEEQ